MIPVTPEAHQAFVETADELGMVQTELANRLLFWLAGRGKAIKSLVAGNLPEESEPAILRQVATDMESHPRRPATPTFRTEDATGTKKPIDSPPEAPVASEAAEAKGSSSSHQPTPPAAGKPGR